MTNDTILATARAELARCLTEDPTETVGTHLREIADTYSLAFRQRLWRVLREDLAECWPRLPEAQRRQALDDEVALLNDISRKLHNRPAARAHVADHLLRYFGPAAVAEWEASNP